MLKVSILGLFHLWNGESVIDATGLRDQTTRALLKYLVLHRRQVIAQEVLIEQFWPNSGSRAGRASLHAAISHVRRVLEPGLDRPAHSRLLKRIAGGYSFQVGPHCLIDHDQYLQWGAEAEARAAAGAWTGVVEAITAAEALVTGELLACEPYADWAATAREAFTAKRVALLELALIGYTRLEQWQAVVATAQQALLMDPAREGIYRSLMLAYAALNETALGLRAFDECRRRLTEEGAEPSAATRAIHAQLLDTMGQADRMVPAEPVRTVSVGLAAAWRPPLSGLPLVGRDRYLDNLPLQLTEGHLVMITGEPGVGKSRLAAEVLARLPAGFHVLSAPCQELESLAFQPLVEALGQLWPQVALRPSGPSGRTAKSSEAVDRVEFYPEGSRAELFATTLGHLQKQISQRSLVLYLDDLHWADQDTLQLLHYLLRQMAGLPFAVLATARQAERDASPSLLLLCDTCRRAGRLTEINLQPLTAGDLHHLVQACAAEPPHRVADLAEQLFQEGGGIPLYALERIRDLMESGALWALEDGRWRWQLDLKLDGRTLPGGVVALAQRRTARLSDRARQLLRTAAVLGQPAPYAWLAAASGEMPAGLLDELDQLLMQNLLVERQTDALALYEVSHHLLREALYHQLSDARRTYLHGRVGEALAMMTTDWPTPPPALVAHHLLAGGLRQEAVAWLRKAGAAEQASMAYTEAVAHLERALALAGELGLSEEIGTCSEELALMLWSQGQGGPKIVHLLRTALDLSGTDTDRVRISLILASTCLGHQNSQAQELATNALLLARSTGEEEKVGDALICMAMAHHHATRYDEALATAQRAQTAYRSLGNEAGEARCYLEMSDTFMRLGRLAEQKEAALAGLRLYDRLGDRQGLIAGRMRLIKAGLVTAQWREAYHSAQALLALVEEVGPLYWAGRAYHGMGWALFRLGELQESVACLEQAITIADRLESRRVMIDARLTLGLVRADQAESTRTGQAQWARDGAAGWTEANLVSTEAVSLASAGVEPEFVVLSLVARAQVLRLQGDFTGAMAALDRAQAEGQDLHQAAVYLKGYRGEVHADLGEAEAALATAAEVLAIAQGRGLPLEEATAIRTQGRALALLGRVNDAKLLLQEAEGRLEQLGAAVELRRTRELLARLSP